MTRTLGEGVREGPHSALSAAVQPQPHLAGIADIIEGRIYSTVCGIEYSLTLSFGKIRTINVFTFCYSITCIRHDPARCRVLWP